MNPLPTFLIQKCTTITSLKQARQLHALILTTTASAIYAQSPYLNNNIISMYARCGSLPDGHRMFDRMPHRTTVSYNALIGAYSKNSSCGFSSFNLYTLMGTQGVRPNGLTFTSLMQACCSLQYLVMGSSLHAQVVKFGFFVDVCVQTSLLGMYSSCGDLDSASEVFANIREKDDVSWNSMILGNLKNNKAREGLCLFGAMVRSSIVPTLFTYSMVLKACSKLEDYSSGEVIHGRVIVSNMLPDLPLQNALLDMYCSCGDTKAAFSIICRIKNPDLVSWNSMISGYGENGEANEAMDVFVRLLRMSFPKPDEYTFAAVVSATGASLATHYGKPLHAQVMKTGMERSVFVGTTLLSMYFKNCDTESAQEVFNSIEEKDVVLCTEMIMGNSRLGNAKGAVNFFCKLCQEGHKSDSFALSGALSACADLANLKQGEMIHSLAIKTGFEAEMSVCGSLVDMYAKNGYLQAARSLFPLVSNPDLKFWNSILSGYSGHGILGDAMSIFEEILEHGISPDHVTFLSLLSACSHSGLVEKGMFFWNYMKKSGILPGLKHYSCMISLLSRVGLLEDAEELIMESNYGKEHLELWRTLLSSCVDKRNLKVGLRAAERVLRLHPEDSATHILLSNLYAAVGKWEGVAEMRKKISGLKLEKDPGLSWIEAKKDIHVFSSGDQLNPTIDEAQAEVHRLKENMTKTVSDEFEAGAFST